MLITLYNFSVIFWPLYSYCLGLEPLAKWCQIMTCAKDHLNLHFRPSLMYVIICLCCSSRTFSTWTNNFTTHAVKSFAFVWKQRWSIFIIYMYISPLFGAVACTCGYCSKQMQTISLCAWWTCLYILTSPTYLVISPWYLPSSNVTTHGENWVFHLVKW